MDIVNEKMHEYLTLRASGRLTFQQKPKHITKSE